MSDSVTPIPPGFHTLTAHIIVSDSKKACAFYEKAFGGQTLGIHEGPDGKVMHAAVKIGDSVLMLNDEYPDFGVLAPTSTNAPSPVTLNLYVPDANKFWETAVGAGCKVLMPIQDQFWGDRYGQVQDPFGHRWAIAQHIKDMTQQELEVAGQEAMAAMAAKK